MPQIPQISGPFTGGKSMTSQNNAPSNAEPFQIDGVNPVQKVNNVTQKAGDGVSAQTGSTENPGLSIPSARDPSMAVETLHDVFSGDLLENAKLNGYTELAGEIDDLTKAIYIKPEGLINEILAQEKNNTVFTNNALFDLLRNLVTGAGEDTKELSANVLKALNYAMSKREIITAITSNIKFLSEYFGANTSIAKNLGQLYQKWISSDPIQNFESLKNETAALMRSVSESLQNDARTQTLIPLVTHNLSRFNTNEYMMKETFSQLLSQVPSSAMREQLSRSFADFVKNLLQQKNISFNNNTTNTQENQVPNENFDTSAEKAAIISYISKFIFGKNAVAAPFSASGAQNAERNTFVNNAPQGNQSQPTAESNSGFQTGQSVGGAFQNVGENGQPLPLNGQAPLSPEQQTANPQNQLSPEQQAANPQNQLSPEQQQAANPQNQLSPEQQAANSQNQLSPEQSRATAAQAKAADNNGEITFTKTTFGEQDETEAVTRYLKQIPASEIGMNMVLMKYDRGSIDGKTAIEQLVRQFLPREASDVGEMLHTVTQNFGSLKEAVNYLNRVLENIPDIPLRQPLASALEGVIGQMAREHELPAEPPQTYESETMKALTTFIDRNVNHPAIKGIDNFNASNLLQSMLNAPGVFTPLAHFILPLQVEDTRAFGELWVDNDNTNSSGGENGEKKYHLFLTFDVEAIGRFEVNAYLTGRDLNLSVLHPKSYRYKINGLTDKISKIAADVGLSVEKFNTGILIKPHTLTETFPRIAKNRRSFDVKA